MPDLKRITIEDGDISFRFTGLHHSADFKAEIRGADGQWRELETEVLRDPSQVLWECSLIVHDVAAQRWGRREPGSGRP